MDDAERERQQSAAEIARQAAVRQAASQLTYLGIMLTVAWAVSNRDLLWRLAERGKNWWKDRNRDPYEAEVAAFRREIADLSRGSDGPDLPETGGLYGPAADRNVI